MGIADTLRENPLVPLIAIAGAVAGGVGGAFAGGGGVLSYVLGGLLTIGGLVGGAYAGHAITRSRDKQTPAPLSVRPVETPKIEPKQQGKVAVKPSANMADAMAEAADKKLEGMEGAEDIKKFMGMAKTALPYTQFDMKGTANEDGTSITIDNADIVVPGAGKISVRVPRVKLPLKDGEIDQSSPEAKAQIKIILEQAIEQHVPDEYKEKARDVLAEGFKVSVSAPSLHYKDANPLHDGGEFGHGGVPDLKPTAKGIYG